MGRFIEDAILSVVKQGYPNFEHIIVDACSQDNTLAILRSYPHVRWLSEPDGGQSDALNKGFRMSTGDLVGWLNADEYYLPGAFHAAGRFAMDNPAADILYGDSIFVDGEGRLQRAKKAHEFSFTILLYYGCFIPTDATFFRRHFIEGNFFIDTNYHVVMDFEYFVRCAASGRHFKYINRLLGSFRWHGSNNNSLQNEKRRKERLLVQRTWSKLKLPDRGYDALAQLARLYHGGLVVLNGNYRSELKALRSRGCETRWFQNEEGRKTCATLLA
jgi:glycosyltransferase involved in cell wall biosynthesis